ncbi:MAG TPA: nucleotide exchange factor GrpE [Patescibacteria group bacterium]|nr:nucleotide exchange factor GrpE [Patescibacteria group bacterium]
MSPKPSVKKLEKRVTELEALLEDERRNSGRYMSQLKYAKADMENLQKQTQRRIEDTISRANGRLLMQLLPVIDELELAIEASGGSGDIIEGVKMVKGKLSKLMEAEGVRPIKALGEPFDPRYHEAVLEVEAPELENGTVAEEMRRGYMYGERVLRASMVKVTRNPGSDEDKGETEDE